MTVKLLTEQCLEFLSLKGGCTGSSESIHVKIPHCWKSHVVAHIGFTIFIPNNQTPLTQCMLGNFSCFCCRLLTFYKINFLKKNFRNTFRVSNNLDPDQDRHSVGPDLDPNCLQRLSADDKSRC